MTIAIMQPYFLPYLGYFQLINLAERFVIYDNIQYTKKGWVNRNRVLVNGKEQLITVPLKKDSDFLDIAQRQIADDFNKKKLLNLIFEGYHKAPQFVKVWPLIQNIVLYPEKNLFEFLRHSIQVVTDFMNINTPLIKSSELNADHGLHGSARVVNICRSLESDRYINPVGGMELYSKSEFGKHGIELKFHNMLTVPYQQMNGSFVSHLSIVDVLMFNPPETYPQLLANFELL